MLPDDIWKPAIEATGGKFYAAADEATILTRDQGHRSPVGRTRRCQACTARSGRSSPATRSSRRASGRGARAPADRAILSEVSVMVRPNVSAESECDRCPAFGRIALPIEDTMKSVVGPLVPPSCSPSPAGVLAGRRSRDADRRRCTSSSRCSTTTRPKAKARRSSESLGLERRVPWSAARGRSRRARHARDRRLLARGLRRRSRRSATPNGVVTETDPAILFLSANAGFRASQRATDRGDVVRRLDNVVKSYGEVLKTEAGACGTDVRRARRGRWTRPSTTITIRAREAMVRSRAPAARRTRRRWRCERRRSARGPTLHGGRAARRRRPT